ncbi:hypothetical protein [Microterricola viridarii]|uniref:Uncharacterized protein n=1 Tax=Microterricola viridarii TaxID=412690 RepID=A0A0X8E328_9MICO|nr:hypothetical protein [Microterricola viridarii]AMB58453.1 hypothetical protein AWU67_05835 [Microterricola viridarii]
MSDPNDLPHDSAEPIPAEPAQRTEEFSVAPAESESEADERSAADAPARQSLSADQNIRLMIVVIVGVVALFFAFGLLALFSPTSASVAALAVIATPIASIVAAYYGITLSIQQVRAAQAERALALDRLAAAEQSARESDVWAAQLESALRVAKVKLNAARVPSVDVDRAAGVDADFF